MPRKGARKRRGKQKEGSSDVGKGEASTWSAARSGRKGKPARMLKPTPKKTTGRRLRLKHMVTSSSGREPKLRQSRMSVDFGDQLVELSSQTMSSMSASISASMSRSCSISTTIGDGSCHVHVARSSRRDYESPTTSYSYSSFYRDGSYRHRDSGRGYAGGGQRDSGRREFVYRVPHYRVSGKGKGKGKRDRRHSGKKKRSRHRDSGRSDVSFSREGYTESIDVSTDRRKGSRGRRKRKSKARDKGVHRHRDSDTRDGEESDEHSVDSSTFKRDFHYSDSDDGKDEMSEYYSDDYSTRRSSRSLTWEEEDYDDRHRRERTGASLMSLSSARHLQEDSYSYQFQYLLSQSDLDHSSDDNERAVPPSALKAGADDFIDIALLSSKKLTLLEDDSDGIHLQKAAGSKRPPGGRPLLERPPFDAGRISSVSMASTSMATGPGTNSTGMRSFRLSDSTKAYRKTPPPPMALISDDIVSKKSAAAAAATKPRTSDPACYKRVTVKPAATYDVLLICSLPLVLLKNELAEKRAATRRKSLSYLKADGSKLEGLKFAPARKRADCMGLFPDLCKDASEKKPLFPLTLSQTVLKQLICDDICAKSRTSVRFGHLPYASLENVSRVFADGGPKLLHFVGYASKKNLLLEDPCNCGAGVWIHESQLKRVLSPKMTQCVVVMSPSPKAVSRLFLDLGVRHVVSIRLLASCFDHCHAEFLVQFYSSILNGSTIGNAFRHARLLAAPSTLGGGQVMYTSESKEPAFELLPNSGDAFEHELVLFPHFSHLDPQCLDAPMPVCNTTKLYPFLGRAYDCFQVTQTMCSAPLDDGLAVASGMAHSSPIAMSSLSPMGASAISPSPHSVTGTHSGVFSFVEAEETGKNGQTQVQFLCGNDGVGRLAVAEKSAYYLWERGMAPGGVFLVDFHENICCGGASDYSPPAAMRVSEAVPSMGALRKPLSIVIDDEEMDPSERSLDDVPASYKALIDSIGRCLIEIGLKVRRLKPLERVNDLVEIIRQHTKKQGPVVLVLGNAGSQKERGSISTKDVTRFVSEFVSWCKMDDGGYMRCKCIITCDKRWMQLPQSQSMLSLALPRLSNWCHEVRPLSRQLMAQLFVELTNNYYSLEDILKQKQLIRKLASKPRTVWAVCQYYLQKASLSFGLATMPSLSCSFSGSLSHAGCSVDDTSVYYAEGLTPPSGVGSALKRHSSSLKMCHVQFPSIESLSVGSSTMKTPIPSSLKGVTHSATLQWQSVWPLASLIWHSFESANGLTSPSPLPSKTSTTPSSPSPFALATISATEAESCESEEIVKLKAKVSEKIILPPKRIWMKRAEKSTSDKLRLKKGPSLQSTSSWASATSSIAATEVLEERLSEKCRKVWEELEYAALERGKRTKAVFGGVTWKQAVDDLRRLFADYTCNPKLAATFTLENMSETLVHYGMADSSECSDEATDKQLAEGMSIITKRQFDALWLWFSGVCLIAIDLAPFWSFPKLLHSHGFVTRKKAYTRVCSSECGVALLRFSKTPYDLAIHVKQLDRSLTRFRVSRSKDGVPEYTVRVKRGADMTGALRSILEKCKVLKAVFHPNVASVQMKKVLRRWPCSKQIP